MTDDRDKPDAESPEADAEGPIGGARLAEARRAKQISVLEIAKELHVEEAKIRALENNEFDELDVTAAERRAYQKLLEDLRVAVHDEEKVRYHLKAVELEIEIFRTKSANERAERRAYGA